ncbi:DNA glycosylase [Auriscalpium vulgare]|uniref:DNA glycosylase n=1 Tax=Auriscalpium vulgare TaxID=40419 RepID=A0ACB8RGX3_9AGAM|nr:DNA glycosylase [Auriscalpium vulgare]
MKRSASSRLAAEKSPFDASVTLFKLEDTDIALPGPSVRRSKRLKADVYAKADIEDVKLEQTVQEIVAVAGTSTPKKAKAKAQVSPRKHKPVQQSLEKPHPAPAHWREAYDAIKEMRAHIVAPVDTMGCDSAQWKETEPKNKRFAVLVSLMLSSQTKDEVTNAAVDKLRAAIGGTLSVDALIAAPEPTVAEAINKVGFWRRKTGYIKQAAQRLRDDFDSDVPKTVDELCSLTGVGPKMAFLALQSAWNINVGIGVDVHVHRITNRLRWHRPATKNPEETRLNLQSWLPTELHPEINHLLVGFGQTICVPVGPRCDQCTLSSTGLCPSAQDVVTSKTRKSIIMASDAGPKLEITVEEDTKINLPKVEPDMPSPLSPTSDGES